MRYTKRILLFAAILFCAVLLSEEWGSIFSESDQENNQTRQTSAGTSDKVSAAVERKYGKNTEKMPALIRKTHEELFYSLLIVLGGKHKNYALNHIPVAKEIYLHNMIFDIKEIAAFAIKMKDLDSSFNLFQNFESFRRQMVKLELRSVSFEDLHNSCRDTSCHITYSGKGAKGRAKRIQNYRNDIDALKKAAGAVCRDLNILCKALGLRDLPVFGS